MHSLDVEIQEKMKQKKMSRLVQKQRRVKINKKSIYFMQIYFAIRFERQLI